MKNSKKLSISQFNPLEKISTPAVIAKLNRLGISRPEDLLVFFPIRYEDETQIFEIMGAPERESVQIEVTVIQAKVEFRPRRQLVVTVEDCSGRAILRFLHFYPSQQRALEPGSRIRALGELRIGRQRIREMVHPKCKKIVEHDQLPSTLTPIYATTKGLTQPAIRKAVMRAFEVVAQADTLSSRQLKHLGLPRFSDAVTTLHRPTSDIDQSLLKDRRGPLWARVSFDELLAQQLIMRQNYNKREKYTAPVMQPDSSRIKKFLAMLEFDLTKAQKNAFSEIQADMSNRIPMRRLLQGDVGSGKTVVSALAALQAIEAGYQVALMVPTEILSEQHFKKIEGWLTVLGIKV